MSARHHLPLTFRAPGARRIRAAQPLAHRALYERVIQAVVTDGSYQDLLPLPIDGLVLVPSRSTEYLSHEVRLQGRRVVRCTGPCGQHVTCFHRCATALAAWSSEHPNWDLEAFRDPTSGTLATSLLLPIVHNYLEAEAQRGRPWTATLDHSVEPERRLRV